MGSYIKETAVICLTVVCLVALVKGIDSVLVGMIAGIMGGIAGYQIGLRRKKKSD